MKFRIAMMTVALGLGGCAHFDDTAGAQATQEEAASDALTAVTEQLGSDSDRLQAVQEALVREMEQRSARPTPVAPDLDYPQLPQAGALVSKKFAISMQDARIGQLLWIVAQEFNLGLSIEPAVLESTKTVNLFLKDVNGRQAIIHILEAFDVHGRVGEDNVLRVSGMEERIFPVDALAVRGALGVNVGGDALGAGAEAGSTGLRDSVVLTGGLGDDKSDTWTTLAKTVETLLADEEGGKGTAGSKSADAARFSLDRSSGSLYIRAKPSKVRTIAQMLERGRTYRGRQVQIDAQLLDVSLNGDSQLGINWTALGKRVLATVGGAPATIGSAAGFVGEAANLLNRSVTIPSHLMGVTGGTGAGITMSNKVFSATINAIQTYGKVKVLDRKSVV